MVSSEVGAVAEETQGRPDQEAVRHSALWGQTGALDSLMYAALHDPVSGSGALDSLLYAAPHDPVSGSAE